MRPFRVSAEVKCRGYSGPLQRALTDFGADESFGKAVEKVREHYGIEVPRSSLRLITAAHGAQMVGEQRAQRAHTLGPEAGVGQLITEMDGSMIPILEIPQPGQRVLQWEEARLCLAHEPGSVTPRFGATLGEAAEAGAVWLACVKGAGGGAETRLHCVGDAAAWILEQAKQQFGERASYLLDFYHVSDYLAAASAVLAPTQPRAWLRQQQQCLQENRAPAVIAALRPAVESEGVAEEAAPVRVCLRYLSNHQDCLDYATARAAGLPIGSGEIESGHRYVVQARLKIAGAWWKREQAEKMLALRVTRANGEWNAYWLNCRQAAA